MVRGRFGVVLLPPRYVRPYVRRSKLDRIDCEALLKALPAQGSGRWPIPEGKDHRFYTYKRIL